MRLYLSLLILFCLYLHGYAQVPTKFTIRQYSTENGLPSNGLKGMQWDEQTGFLWLATEAGVVRFNGIDFKTYTKDNTSIIESERMRFMSRNRKGIIYTADLSGNIIKIDKNQLVLQTKIYSNNDSGNYNLFALTVSEQFFQYKQTHPLDRLITIRFNKILPISDTSMFVVSGNALYEVSLHSQSPVQISAPAIKVRTIFRIGAACFAVDVSGVVFKVDPALKQFQPVKMTGVGVTESELKSTNLRFFWESGITTPVIILKNKAWVLSYNGNTIELKEICNVVPTNALINYVQYSEAKKVLFIGTESKGLTIITQNTVEPIVKQQTASNERNAYYAQVELPNGGILTNEGHVLGAAPIQKADLPIQDKFNFTVYTTGDSLLWFAQQYNHTEHFCLHVYQYKTKKTIAYPKISLSQTFGVSVTKSGIYIATEKGIGLLKGDSLQYQLTIPIGKRVDASPFMMQELETGELALASCNGLVVYHTATQKTDTLLSIPGYCVRTIRKYGEYLLIGTYGRGCYIYKKGKLVEMPLDKNKFLLYTHCFVPDEFGYCWMSTNRGLIKAKMADLFNAFESNQKQVYYHYLGKNDGMAITEMNGGCAPCALTLKDKTISFPTMDGILKVDPIHANPLLPSGDVYIDQVVVDSANVGLDIFQQTKLPTSAREILIKLGFSAWCNRENIYIDYRLNLNGQWLPIQRMDESEIKLSGLQPGNYILQIRKLNGFGEDNVFVKEIVFSIARPWYQYWWFYILCLLIIVGLIALYLDYRTRRYKIRQRILENQVAEKTSELQRKNDELEKTNTIKTRLISIISHDIVTPLKFVAVAGKNLMEKRKLMPEELQQETIGEITNTAQELQLLSTNILNWIKYQNENRRLVKESFNVHEVVNQIFSVLQSMANQKNIKLINEVNPYIEVYQFYEPLKILLYNLVTNAIHFSEKGAVRISAQTEPGLIQFKVTDDGVGMSADQIQNIMSDEMIVSSANSDKRKGNGLGYLIIKDLVKMMGASLKIESEKKKGTTVIIKVEQQTVA